MNTPPNREVTLFSAALELPAGERVAYLAENCADDPALRLHLETLLRVHEDALTFLESKPPRAQAVFGVPASAGSDVQGMAGALPAEAGTPSLTGSPAEKAGDRIGRYKLLQQIGEGGCGVVYMAEQEEPVRRRVALKVIKLGMDTRQVIARFEAERQALALMDHPNIAKVLDAGATDAGRPYFVMELVRGIKITDYCDQNNLSTEERLRLFTQVCQAIQHAHQKGIIHRDIKPSNILVTITEPGAPGSPKVIDFGIAKATTGQRLTEKTVFTAFEQFIGTPAYMSPEQAVMTNLDVDTRSDIYSLGVLLYELLTGKTPLDQKELLAAGLEEMRRTIREKEPIRPSTRLSTMLEGELTTTANHRHIDAPKLIHLLRGDLDWIVMKALEKDRARRYETANSLANDVQHYLADEPVVARPPSGAYRLQKLVRRNKGVFAGVGAVILMLVLGVVSSTWQAVRASQAVREQERLRLKADAQGEKAQAEAGVLKKMLRGIGPSVAKGRNTELLQELVDLAIKNMATDLTNQPEVEVDLSLTLAEAYHDMGSLTQMVAVARHCLQVARTKLGPQNESVADSLINLGTGLLSLAQQHLGEIYAGNVPEVEKDRRLQDPNLREAEKCCLDGLAMLTNSLGNENVKVAFALALLGHIRLTQYKLAEAETLQRQSLAMYRKLKEHSKKARMLRQLALLLGFREDRLAEAEAMAREALAMQKELLSGDHPDIAKSRVMLATLLRRQGKLAQAEIEYREGIMMWKRLVAKENTGIASALNYLSEVLLEQGKLADAETARREELGMSRSLNGYEHANVVVSLSWLAYILRQEGKLEEAEARAREALALSRKLLDAGRGSLEAAIDPVDALMGILLAQNRNREAEQLLADLLKANPQEQQLRIGLLRLRGFCFARCHRWQEAIADLSKVVELEASDEGTAFALTVLLVEIGDRENYRLQCQKMVTSFRAANAPGPLGKTAEACLLWPEGSSGFEAAGPMADQAFKLGQSSFLVHDLRLIKGLAEYRTGQFASAIDWAGQSIGQPDIVAGARPDAAAYSVLAMAQHHLKRSDEAQSALAKAVDIVDAKLLKLENAALDENWVDWLLANFLLREAQALIQPPPAATKN